MMRVAALQFTATEDKAANAERIRELVAQAADAGARLVVAPEASMHGFGAPNIPLAPVAEPIDGPFVQQLRKAASEHSVTLLAGMFESAAGDARRVYNTIVAVDPAGEVIGSYRKQHLFDALGWVESERVLAGSPRGRLVFGCEGLTVGVLTCYDVRFPELARSLVDDGADVLAVPAAWVFGPLKEDQWTTLVRARAIENVVYVAAADQAPPQYSGRSAIVDPFGVVLASLGEGEGLVVADVDPARLHACRERMPSVAHRRWRVAPIESPD